MQNCILVYFKAVILSIDRMENGLFLQWNLVYFNTGLWSIVVLEIGLFEIMTHYIIGPCNFKQIQNPETSFDIFYNNHASKLDFGPFKHLFLSILLLEFSLLEFWTLVYLSTGIWYTWVLEFGLLEYWNLVYFWIGD